MKKNVTIKDIAQFAGVSKTTVSHYLNGHFNLMSERTKEKIGVQIAAHDYRPSSLARSLKSRKSGLVGVLIPDLHGPGMIKMFDGLNRILSENRYNPIFQVYHAGNIRDAKSKCIQACLDLRVDGMIVNMNDDDISPYAAVQERGIPIVLMGGVRDYWKYDAVYIDHYAAARLALEKMTANGYRNIFFIGEDPGTVYLQGLRKKAYLDFVCAAGGGDGNERCFTVHPWNRAVAAEMGEIIDRILADKTECKAVIADSSTTLKELLKGLKNRRVVIPERLGVCGYDAWDWCELFDPSITALQSSSYEMAREAARLLVERMEGRENRIYRRITIDSILIERESTRKLES